MSAREPPPTSPWPPEDLEYLDKCPVCGRARRTLMFEGLSDLAFGVAPGAWNLWRCADCSAGYIDPRPSQSSIGRAYANYYTHESKDGARMASFIGGSSVKTRLKVGYYNVRYGYRLPTGLAVGALVAAASTKKKGEWDYFIRHLPPPGSPSATLLDIGSGSGDFLRIAEQLGYTPLGLDPDPSATEYAIKSGLRAVVGGLPDTGLDANAFDQICLSHVLEHLHEPIAGVNELLRLLKPGGRVWLTQPNIDAIGLEIFGRNWRGLEAPRHLCLMTADGLETLFRRAGFVDVELLRPRPEASGSFMASLSMTEGEFPRDGAVPSGWNDQWRRRALEADRVSATKAEAAESLTLIAWKPMDSPPGSDRP